MDALGPELVDTPNGALSVRRVGNGDPMVVIPGGPGFGCDYLIGPLTDLLADDHDLIFIDQRGAGASPVGYGPLTMDAYVDDMVSVADELGLSRFDLLGNSFGGLQAQYFAIAHPERVRRIVLADSDGPRRADFVAAFATGGPFSRRRRQEDVDEVARIETIDGWMDDPDLFERYLVATFRHWYVDPETVETIEHGLTPDRLVQFDETSKRVRASMGDWDITSDLRRVEAPTLIMACNDSILGAQIPVLLDETLPHSHLVWVDGGHLPFVEDPEAFNEAGAGFFATH